MRPVAETDANQVRRVARLANLNPTPILAVPDVRRGAQR